MLFKCIIYKDWSVCAIAMYFYLHSEYSHKHSCCVFMAAHSFLLLGSEAAFECNENRHMKWD